MKFLAMHITNQKLSFDIFMVGNLLNIFMEHDLVSHVCRVFPALLCLYMVIFLSLFNVIIS